MPAFAIGRAGWDNWMIYARPLPGLGRGRCHRFDARIVHQNHDYSHLPGGQPHYRLPETGVNIRLAGGRRAIFGLGDTNRRLVRGQLARHPASWAKIGREVEIFPLVRLHAMPLGQLFFAALSPGESLPGVSRLAAGEENRPLRPRRRA